VVNLLRIYWKRVLGIKKDLRLIHPVGRIKTLAPSELDNKETFAFWTHCGRNETTTSSRTSLVLEPAFFNILLMEISWPANEPLLIAERNRVFRSFVSPSSCLISPGSGRILQFKHHISGMELLPPVELDSLETPVFLDSLSMEWSRYEQSKFGWHRWG
jgi:hypothetical protein